MNPTFKRYLVSSLTTFLTSFFGVLSVQLSQGVPEHFTIAFVISLLTVAGRAAIKVVVESGVGMHADPVQE